MERAPEHAPKMKDIMSVITEAMKSFGCKLTRVEGKTLVMELHSYGLADTEAQTKLAGLSLLKKLNFPPEKMMETSHAIRGAANSDLDVMGATLLRLENPPPSGPEH